MICGSHRESVASRASDMLIYNRPYSWRPGVCEFASLQSRILLKFFKQRSSNLKKGYSQDLVKQTVVRPRPGLFDNEIEDIESPELSGYWMRSSEMWQMSVAKIKTKFRGTLTLVNIVNRSRPTGAPSTLTRDGNLSHFWLSHQITLDFQCLLFYCQITNNFQFM